jgi:hypothetical protein
VIPNSREPKMNERIKELADKASQWVIDNSNGVHAPYERWNEKFAELIMKECIRVPYDMWDKAELNADIAVKIEHRIRDHFGVEE